MASMRVSIKNEARRLAAADAGTTSGRYGVSQVTIRRLQQMLQVSDRPVQVLRWAWRSQLATYIDSDSYVEGLASMYLHATLLDMQHGNGCSNRDDP